MKKWFVAVLGTAVIASISACSEEAENGPLPYEDNDQEESNNDNN